MANTGIRRAGIGITGFATLVAAAALGAPTASAVPVITEVVLPLGGDPGVYTIWAAVIASPEDATALLYFYDKQTDSTGATTADSLIAGPVPAPTVAEGDVQVTWHPTATGNHTVYVVERTPTGQMINGNFNNDTDSVTVTQLPQSAAPVVTDPAGQMTSNSITVNALAFHPNTTYTATAPATAVPAGDQVFFEDNSTVVGQATVTNGVATAQFTPTTLGTHALSFVYGPASGPVATGVFAGQTLVEVTTPPAKPSGTGSADGIPVLGKLLQSLGI